MTSIRITKLEVTAIMDNEYPVIIYYLPSGVNNTPWIRLTEDPYSGVNTAYITNEQYEEDLKNCRELK